MRPIKTRALLVPIVLAALSHASIADQIKQGSSYNKTVLAYDSTGANVLGLTTSSFTTTVSKNGGAESTITTPTVTEVGHGKYSVALTPSLTSTLGDLDLTMIASGVVQIDSHDQVVAFDPDNAASLGLSNLDVASSSRMASFTLPSNFSILSINGSGAITTSNPATGGGGVDPLANATSTYASSGTVGYYILQTLARRSDIPTDYQQRGVAVTLGSTDAGNLATAAAQTPSAFASYVALSSGSATGTSTPALTTAQRQALNDSVNFGNYDATAPTASGTATFRYYLVGRAHTTPNLTETATVTYDASKYPVSRNVVVANPFPTIP